MIEMPFAAPHGYVGAVPAPAEPVAGFWFVFRGDRLLVEAGEPATGKPDDPRAWPRPRWARLPMTTTPRALGLEPLRTLYLGQLGDAHCFGAEVPTDAPAPQGSGWHGLRALFTVLDDAFFALAGRALQLLEWDRTHQFCGRCGTPTAPRTTERSRECPACGLVAYPRLAPAVMALVRRLPDEILLARSARFPPGMYSALAGFVEPGETIEDCIRREVREEVGIEITDIRYFASQSWAFPHSLMIAYTAEYAGGELRPDESEIVEARWFPWDAAPNLPPSISISRRLIAATIERLAKEVR